MGHSRELIPTPHSLFCRKTTEVPQRGYAAEKVNISIGMVLIDNHSRREVARLLRHIGLGEGSKVLFFIEDDTLLIKKITAETWESITTPLRQQNKKIQEKNVDALIHKMRQ